MATLFIFLEKRISHSLSRTYKQFLQNLDSRFTRRSSEYLLEKIANNSREQADALRNFSSELSGKLTSGVTESLSPILNKLADAIERLEVEKSSTLEQSMKGLISEFQTAMTASAGGEMKELGNAVQSTVQLLQLANQQASSSQNKMDEVMLRMDESLRKQAESTTGLMSKLAATVEEMTSKVRDSSETSSQALSARVTNLMEAIDATAQRNLNDSRMQAEKLQEPVAGMSSRVEEALKFASVQMESTATGILGKSNDYSEATTKKLSSMMDVQSDGVKLLNDASEVVARSVNEFKNLLEGSSENQRSIRDGLQNLKDASVILKEEFSVVRAVHSDVSSVSTGLRVAADSVHTAQSQNKALLAEYERVFEKVDQSIGGILQKIHDQTQKYHQAIGDTLTQYLKDFDNSLASAATSLSHTVDELKEGLDELSDTLSAKKAVGG